MRILVTATMAGLLACGQPFFTPQPEPPFPEPSGAGAITEMGIEHHGCFGSCSVYAYRFSQNGDAVYLGDAFVPVLGKYAATIDSIVFRQLADLLLRKQFFRLPSQYPLVFDVSSVMLWAKVGDTAKTVYASGIPEQLAELVAVFDSVGARLDWRPADSR